MRTIAIMNNKGGVGKTVTAINVADLLVREHGKTVVIADCDGQKNLTDFYDLPGYDQETCFSTAKLLLGDCEPLWSDNTVPLPEWPGLELIPASTDLYDLDLEAVRLGRHAPIRMVDFVDAAREDGEVDFFLFDCPPGFTVASVGALMAADEVIVPVTVDGFSIRGLDTIQSQIRTMRRTGVKRVRVLITQYHKCKVVQAGEELLRSSGFDVFRTVIRRSVKVPESTFKGQPLAEYAPGNAATNDYRALVRELLGEV